LPDSLLNLLSHSERTDNAWRDPNLKSSAGAVRADKAREDKRREDVLLGFYVQDVNRIAGSSISYS
jgi:hypothetical protein